MAILRIKGIGVLPQIIYDVDLFTVYNTHSGLKDQRNGLSTRQFGR